MKDDAQAYEGREFEAASNLVNYYNWITDLFRPYLYGSGVEIGAGIGTYSQYLRPFFSTLDVVEPSPTQRNFLAERFQSDENVHAFSETIDSYRQRRGDESRDSVCMVNVLEHIEDDHTALLGLTAILKKGGHLCIFVPALPFLYSKLDEVFGHHRRYTRSELVQKASNAGLEIITCKYMDFAGVFAWGLINTLCKSTNLNPRAMQIYDRAIIPITRTVESVVPAPIGKSLVLIAKKSG